MTSKEKVLAIYPDDAYIEKVWTDEVEYQVRSKVLGLILGTSADSEEAAWQNAAESLPAQPEICAHGLPGCAICHRHAEVAEPKPTPSEPKLEYQKEDVRTFSTLSESSFGTHIKEAVAILKDWKRQPDSSSIPGRVECKHCGNRIYPDWRHHGSNMKPCYGGLDSEAEPRDSSSISTQPEGLVSDEHVQAAIDEHKTFWSEEIAIELQSWRKWAKGQSNGR